MAGKLLLAERSDTPPIFTMNHCYQLFIPFGYPRNFVASIVELLGIKETINFANQFYQKRHFNVECSCVECMDWRMKIPQYQKIQQLFYKYMYQDVQGRKQNLRIYPTHSFPAADFVLGMNFLDQVQNDNTQNLAAILHPFAEDLKGLNPKKTIFTGHVGVKDEPGCGGACAAGQEGILPEELRNVLNRNGKGRLQNVYEAKTNSIQNFYGKDVPMSGLWITKNNSPVAFVYDAFVSNPKSFRPYIDRDGSLVDYLQIGTNKVRVVRILPNAQLSAIEKNQLITGNLIVSVTKKPLPIE